MTRDELLKQCEIETFRGATVDVRVTHKPTGFVEEEKNVKSVYQGRENCLWRLGQRLVHSASPDTSDTTS